MFLEYYHDFGSFLQGPEEVNILTSALLIYSNVPAHDVAQFFQIGSSEVAVVSVAALDVLFDAVQI